MQPARRGLIMAAVAFASWGLLSPGNEILLRQLTPMWMQTIRGAAASLIVLAWLGRSGLDDAMAILRDPKLLRALSLGTFLSFALFAYSQTRIPAAATTLGFYTAPIWTALLARAMLGERMGKSFGPAVIMLLVGGWLALTGGGAIDAPDGLGVLLALGSGATWGAYAVLLRRHGGDVGWRPLLLASMMLGTVGFVVIAALTEPLPPVTHFTGTTWAWSIIQVAFPTLFSLALFQRALRVAPAGQINMLVGIELASTVVLAWLILGAQFTLTQLGGIGLALFAVSYYLWDRNRAASRIVAGSDHSAGQ